MQIISLALVSFGHERLGFGQGRGWGEKPTGQDKIILALLFLLNFYFRVTIT